jgi:hypothetical protein
LASKPFALTRDFAGIAPINYSDLVLVAHSIAAGLEHPGIDQIGQG